MQAERSLNRNFFLVKEINNYPDSRLLECLKPNEKENQLRGMYLINTRLWMSEIREKYGQETTIDLIPDKEWNKMFEKYDNFWFMGIYKPSEFSQEHAKKYAHEYTYALPDIDKEKDIIASPFAIAEYSPNPLIAKNWKDWDKMVEKLHKNGKKVFVDFVPNHTGIEFSWVKEHPEYYIQGTKEQYESNQNFYFKTTDNNGQTKYLTHGKDPYCPEWADTLQLNYANPEVQEKMEEILFNLVKHADGVRCDMSALLLPKVFTQTWGLTLTDEEKNYIKNNNFWEKVIPKVKELIKSGGRENFEFIAEAYWEKDKLEEHFDYIYNHDLYQTLVKVAKGEKSSWEIKNEIKKLLTSKKKCNDVLYGENHDEERVINTIGEKFSKTTIALIAMMSNSMLMINQGQERGSKIRPPMQISRFPNEKTNEDLLNFYDNLLKIRKSKLFQTGEWKMLETSDNNLIELEVESKELKARAVVCFNVGISDLNCEINKSNEKVRVYNLTEGNFCPAEEVTENKVITKLKFDEVKIVYLIE